MRKDVQVLNQKFGNKNMEIRKVRPCGGYPYSIKSLDITLPRRLSAKMNLAIGDYITCELQQLRSGNQCLVIRKLDLTNSVGEAIEQ